MQPVIFGEISCKNVAPTFGLKRRVDDALQQWALSAANVIPENLFYEIVFEPAAQIHTQREFVSCRAKIMGRQQMWIGTGVAKNSREAFAKAMADLTKIFECLDFVSEPRQAIG